MQERDVGIELAGLLYEALSRDKPGPLVRKMVEQCLAAVR